MSKDIKRINTFFRTALKDDVDSLRERIILSQRQERIFDMFYVKKNDIGFIADSLNVCVSVVNDELRLIRGKILRII
ncbi:MAG: hypothetical protein L6V86_09045 [Treponema sp.]|nr:MAG: hypothetical protein L6V86_09045 [Treponema sp.]